MIGTAIQSEADSGLMARKSVATPENFRPRRIFANVLRASTLGRRVSAIV